MENIRERHSLRLQGYDYKSPGHYYVTICTRQAMCILSTIAQDKVLLTQLGKIADACWQEISNHFLEVSTDEYVIMPNHMHGIIQIGFVPSSGVKHTSLETVMTAFKSACTRAWGSLECRKTGSLWQHDYYERIIRDDNELHRFRQYILQNPVKWHLDDSDQLGGSNSINGVCCW